MLTTLSYMLSYPQTLLLLSWKRPKRLGNFHPEEDGMPQEFIRIVSRPAGSAPEVIRDKWIGLVLPVFNKSKDERLADVMTRALVTDRQGGVEVLWSDAMRILGEREPLARDWWVRNIHGSPSLIFDEGCCELASK